MAIERNGSIDMPATIDQFKIDKYVEGLVKFISECNTPMTLAIQGDWGTGKTSIMTMVQNRLYNNANDKIECVWFNTWQFSQFNMGEQLPLLMMSKLVSAVSNGKGETTKKIKDIFVGIAGVATGYLTGGGANREDIKEILASDLVQQIDELKGAFQKLIKEKAVDDGRVVVFIDDLDRLQPGKAVELLEVLKVFLDCEQCVFVLAIDYGVVCRGVKEKYGEDFSDEKGKSFFDKIIQVPFKMPVAEYNIINYIREGFKNIGMKVEEDILPTYESLIKNSIGNNPRGMKRLFNSFLLLKYVADEKIFNDSHQTALLFALLCMQSRFETVYNYLIENRPKVDENLIKELLEPSEESMNQFKMEKKDKDDFSAFIVDFTCVIDRDGSLTYDIAEINDFKYVLSFSAITANNVNESINNLGEYRWRHKDICRRIKERLNTKYASNNIEFFDWYNIKDKGTWWVYARNEKEGINPKFGQEFRLDPMPGENGMNSSMSVSIYSVDTKKVPINFISDKIGSNPLSELGYVSEIEGRIWYKNIYQFETTDANAEEEIFNIFCKIVDVLLKYINM